MLAGHPPCAGDSYLKVIHRHLEGDLPDLTVARPEIPTAVAELYRWMTRRDPAARPRSYAELLAAVDRLRSSGTTAEIRLGAVRRSHGTRWAVAVALAALALVGGLIWAWWRSERSSSRQAVPVRPSPAVAPVASTLPSTPLPPRPRPGPEVSPPEATREVMSFRTGHFGLGLEMLPGPPRRFIARTGRTAYLTLFTLEAPGD